MISVLMGERKEGSEKQRHTEGHMKAEVETRVTLPRDINGRSQQKLEEARKGSLPEPLQLILIAGLGK